MVAPERNLAVLPDAVDFATAAVLTCAGMTAVHATRMSGLASGQTAVVNGVGGVGILVIQAAARAGAAVIAVADSADKAARFISLCNAYNIPLVYLADVSGFMVGSKVERAGIIRHGAKMVFATSQATVPKICVVVRKAYGAGLYAMAGPGFEPDATLALPTANIAVMGAEAAVNAVYYNKLATIADPDEREKETGRLRADYDADIDILRLAGELVVDDVVEPEDLRAQLIRRFGAARGKDRSFSRRRHGVTPV